MNCLLYVSLRDPNMTWTMTLKTVPPNLRECFSLAMDQSSSGEFQSSNVRVY